MFVVYSGVVERETRYLALFGKRLSKKTTTRSARMQLIESTKYKTGITPQLAFTTASSEVIGTVYIFPIYTLLVTPPNRP